MSLRRLTTAFFTACHGSPVPGNRTTCRTQRLRRPTPAPAAARNAACDARHGTELRRRCRPTPLRCLLPALYLLFTAFPAPGQPRPGIAYYDLDHFHDTVPALFYDDSDYTPAGRLAWDTERYRRKVRNTAAVVDSMRLPLVALWSVENEAVVRDIAAACQGDYSYLHRTLNSFDGMDFALLYYGDLFEPYYDEPGRRYLYIEGVLHRPARRITGHPGVPTRTDTVGLVLCSDTRMAEWVVRDLREERPGVKLLVAGRSSSLDPAAFGLYDALERPARSGRGNVRRRDGWQMRDRILADTALRTRPGDVFARRYLFDPKTGTPRPTYVKRHYEGGYSYALPVFVYLE